jgi:hypothetical protein
MYTIAYLKDGKVKSKEFTNKNEANNAFVVLNRKNLPIVTRTGYNLMRVWNGEIKDFVEPIIRNPVVYTDDIECDIVASYINQMSDDRLGVDDLTYTIGDHTYSIEADDVHQDEQMAAMYNEPDKYGYWRFYDENNTELAELRWGQ